MNFERPAAARHCVIRYTKPRTLDEALVLLGDGKWRIVAGGTDFYPGQGNRPIRENILDINGLGELRGISEADRHYVIGARTTWTEIVQASGLPPAFDALKQVAREVGSVQIQNVGTVAGNLCNASPAADGAPGLLALDAEVELSAASGVRHLPLGSFILGNRSTALNPNEMVTAIRVPKASAVGTSSFVKLGARRYLVISIAMAAARIELDAAGGITAAAISVGSCSAVAQRLGELERRLIGLPDVGTVEEAISASPLSELVPIDDVRGSADYRREAAREIVQRAVGAAIGAYHTRGLAA